MSQISKQVIEAAQYLEGAGLTRRQLLALHHRKSPFTFRGLYEYFSVPKDFRKQTLDFAYRVIFVARHHSIRAEPFDVLIQQALKSGRLDCRRVTIWPVFLSPAKAGFRVLGAVIPGLRSLRSLTRGYILPPLRGLLTATPRSLLRPVACAAPFAGHSV